MNKAKRLKAAANEVYSDRFPRRSKKARAAERHQRVEMRERRWLAEYNAKQRAIGLEPIGEQERQLPARRKSRRGRRRPLAVAS